MKKRMYNNLLAMILIGILIFSLTACGGDSVETAETAEVTEDKVADVAEESTELVAETSYDTEWAIYWYICGSDLESEGGAATIDILELCETQLPENVKVIIQTGGASAWQNDFVSPEYLERYVYDSNGLQLIEQQPLASMGSEQTLSEFLGFAKTNYPANKTAVIFWNHGGGSVNGAEFDENFESDSLTLDEMYNAFGANYELSAEKPPFELIGFDTCLMATVDVAYTFTDIGKYLVASQEVEPGNGWLYTDLAEDLGNNPSMEGLEFGKVICDTYKDGCELVGTQDNITLSVINLSKVSELLAAYNDFGKEALANACVDPAFFSHFGRVAGVTENYGGNTKEQGFTNMVDLGHLARQTYEMLPETSDTVLAALENCVEYKVNGLYRLEATGLSCYYSYNGDVDDYIGYANVGAGEAFKYFYAYGLTGELSEDGMNYISEMNYDTIQPLETLETQGWENHVLDVDSEGAATLTLGEKAADVLSGMYIQLYYVDLEQDIMLLLGTDNDLIGDWETGVFKDNFRGVWGSIDGKLVNMELSYEGVGYNLYSVPVLINGEEYNLSVVYDIAKAEYEIQGARKPIDENGMADKNLYYLIEGDEITTIHYAMPISGEDNELAAVEVDQITWSNDMSFEEIELGEGTFMQMFEMRDMQGYSAYSDVIMFETAADGTITTTVGFTE
jgi:hypothetical protein